MSGYLLRFFPRDPKENAKSSDVKHSEGTTGLADFDFTAATLSAQEGSALAAGFKTNLDKFLSRNNVNP